MVQTKIRTKERTLTPGAAYDVGEHTEGLWAVARTTNRFLTGADGFCVFFASEQQALDAYAEWAKSGSEEGLSNSRAIAANAEKTI